MCLTILVRLSDTSSMLLYFLQIDLKPLPITSKSFFLTFSTSQHQAEIALPLKSVNLWLEDECSWNILSPHYMVNDHKDLNTRQPAVQEYLFWCRHRWYISHAYTLTRNARRIPLSNARLCWWRHCLRDREVAYSDLQGSNFESCVWRAVSSRSSHHL